MRYVPRYLMALVASLLPASTLYAQGYVVRTLVDFSGTNGSGPLGGLTLSGGSLYGTTNSGGANGDGTVFSLDTATSSFMTLASFSESAGKFPMAGVTLSGGSLYGTTKTGGASGEGTVFSVPIGGGSPIVLASFNFDGFNTGGANPTADLALSGSTLYGTTSSGGSNSLGTLFSIPSAGGAVKTLVSFGGSNNSGINPMAGLTLVSGTLYGTTVGGGPGNSGTVFSAPVAGGSPAVLASFSGMNGSGPSARLISSGGILYGTTEYGGINGDGTVFSLNTVTGSLMTLASFNGTNGRSPLGSLTLIGNTLYGSTSLGGVSSDGTLFSVPVTGGAVTTLTNFNGANGQNPFGGLTLGPDGVLYGNTQAGGAYGDGTLFALTPAAAPEPSQTAALGLGVLGLAGLAVKARRRRHSA